MQKQKCILVTGANGFVGKYLVTRLLECSLSKSKFKNINEYCANYDKIIALDIQPPECIAESFKFTPFVLPYQCDLSKLISRNSMEYQAMRYMLSSEFDVECIVHVAGLVDTRETKQVVNQLNAVNTNATKALFDLANECNVSRFIYISSCAADAHITDNINRMPFYFQQCLRGHSLLNGAMYLSSYGKSKCDAEKYITSQSTTKLRSVVLRPHVVWGRGDTLSTELLLSWPNSTHVLIGEPDTVVVGTFLL